MDIIKAEQTLKRKITTTQGDCTLIQGATNNSGYVMFRVGDKHYLAHRVSYIVNIGPVPDGQVIRHTCDNRRCISPEHLLPGTTQQNADDMKARGRSNTGTRHWNSRLTEDQVINIYKAAHLRTAMQKEIAAVYGVHPVTVSEIKRKVKWTKLLDSVDLD